MTIATRRLRKREASIETLGELSQLDADNSP